MEVEPRAGGLGGGASARERGEQRRVRGGEGGQAPGLWPLAEPAEHGARLRDGGTWGQ